MATDRRQIEEKLDRLDRIRLANLPTPVYRLDRVSAELGKNIWIKRDDFTGAEMSGNKVRKLEFTAAKALKEGADVLITAGGIITVIPVCTPRQAQRQRRRMRARG